MFGKVVMIFIFKDESLFFHFMINNEKMKSRQTKQTYHHDRSVLFVVTDVFVEG